MLLAAGTAFTGLTTSAVILVPAIAAAVVVGSGVARRLRPGLVAAGLLLAFPLTMGVLVTLSGDDVGDTSYELLPSGREFLATFSDSPIVLAVTVLGFATGWFFTRSSVTRALACAAALCCFLALLPPLRGLAHALTATGPVLWRWQLLVPLPVLVGLAAVGLGRLLVQRVGRLRTRPFLQVLPASLVVVAMVLAGDTANGKADTAWQGRPGWDVRPDSLRAARAALALPAPPGTVLLPDAVSMTLAKTSADRFTVSARPNYTAAMASQPGFDATARAGLERFVRSGRANSDAPAARIPRCRRARRRDRVLPQAPPRNARHRGGGRLPCRARPRRHRAGAVLRAFRLTEARHRATGVGLDGTEGELVVGEQPARPPRKRKAVPAVGNEAHRTGQAEQVVAGRETDVCLVRGIATLLGADQEYRPTRPQVGQVRQQEPPSRRLVHVLDHVCEQEGVEGLRLVQVTGLPVATVRAVRPRACADATAVAL